MIGLIGVIKLFGYVQRQLILIKKLNYMCINLGYYLSRDDEILFVNIKGLINLLK